MMERLSRSTALFAALLGLAACSGDDRAPATVPPAPGPAAVAMARGTVDVEGGLVRITARRGGVVRAIGVEDGDTVRAGQVLAELDPQQARIHLAAAQAELDQAEAQARVLAAKLPAAEQNAERLRAAAAEGAVTGQSSNEAQTAAAVLHAEAASAQAAVELARQHVAAARYALDQCTIKAPVAGRIVRRTVQVGDSVSAEASNLLFQLLPDRPRIVRAELNEAFVSRVKPGMAAVVSLDADPSQHYAATVLRIGEVFGPSKLAEDPQERASARDVECVLKLGNDADLRIGQRVLVRFLPEPAGGR